MGRRVAKFFVINNKQTLFGGTVTEAVASGFRIEHEDGDDEVVMADKPVGMMALSTSKRTKR